ncbi:MAG: helix-turn-helix domain-containing protein [Actinobacteria bacterium]|nr:helix-turn-helix domain-containing protein [Actinomycetota bacterium]
MSERSAFWADHEAAMADPEYRHHFILESRRVAAVDAIVNTLDEIREQQGLSKAELARAVERDPAVVRRLLTAQQVNPSLGMVADLAMALGYEMVLSPLSEADLDAVTRPLRELAIAARRGSAAPA